MTLSDRANQALGARNYHEAAALYKSAVAEDPHNPIVLQGLARSLFELHQHDEAALACQRALSLDASLPLPHVTLSYIYGRRGEVASCKQEAATAYRLNPALPETLLCWGTACLLPEGDLDSAIELLQKVVGADPNSPNAHYNLAVAWSEKGRMDLALVERHKAWQLEPSLRNVALLAFAYLGTHKTTVGVVPAIVLLLAAILRMKYLLLIPLLLVVSELAASLFSLLRGQWKPGLRMLLYGIGTAILLYTIYLMYFKP